MATVQKNLRITKECADMLSEISNQLEMSEATFINELVRNYAIDLGKVEGVKNYALEEAMLVPTYEKKATTNNLSEELSKLRQDIRIIKSMLNEIDEYGYISRDILNVLLRFMHPEQEPKEFREGLPSTDTKLSILNQQNEHPFLKQSKTNYAERIRRNQIESANK